MTDETKTKKNTDYSNSAVNLNNHEETIKAYRDWQLKNIQANMVQQAIDESVPPNLIAAREEANKAAAESRAVLEACIKTNGGYQDVDNGFYALQQRKVSKSYDATKFGSWYPQFKDAVVIPSVNVKALEGLIKGGLIHMDDPAMNEIITKTESFVYIIK
jgi:hypothetical protein